MATEQTQPETPEPRSATCVWAVVESFLRWSVDSGKKPNSVKQYRTRLKPLQAKFDRREFGTLTPIEIDDWLSAEGKFANGSPKAPDTRRITIIALQQLHQYALDKKVIRDPLIGKLKKPTGRKRNRLLTTDEIDLIIKHSSTEFGRIVRAFLQCGARPSELAAATFANWNQQRKMIVLTEHKTDKTGEERKIAVGKKLLPIIQEATAGRTEGHLFLSPRGRPWTSSSLTQSFTRARKRAALPGGLILYLTRHKFASELCAKKGIHAAKNALGHKSIATTQRYVHSQDDELLSDQDAVGDDLPTGEADDLPAAA